jgi:alpha-N-arabinofuranosidase
MDFKKVMPVMGNKMKTFVTALTVTLAACVFTGCATEYHVSTTGLDGNPGSKSQPFKTISAAAQIAKPGDTITVHEGTYRERVNPPRGGTSDDKRIVYQAAPGEKVVIKGSEVVKEWKKVENDTWKVILPNSFFGDFNPFKDVIYGDWFRAKGLVHHTGSVYLKGHWLTETYKLEDVTKPIGKTPLWFTQADKANVTIWAQFKGVNPNNEDVEVNVRQAVFYPEKPGMNYIMVRGFTMEQAATPWAPPTSEQIGLIGTHWSRGWIIENNTIRYSVCTGVTLGKHGDEWDNKAESAFGYVQTINRALERGWSKENIGHHVVRGNHISHCGQAGIVGSMGAVFSRVTGNDIHDIHLGRAFSGAEMAGIKFHGAIDTVICNNHIYRCGGHGGIWLDWMTQGTRVTGNLLHNNSEDLFVEVNHGPFLVDNNIFLSPRGLLEASGGGAYVHNLFGCQVRLRAEKTRDTPFHKPHSTEVVGLSKVVGDDERFYNNLLVGHGGLSVYDAWTPVNLQAVGNVYLAGAKPSTHDRDALVVADFDPGIKLQEKSDGWQLEMAVDPVWLLKQKRAIVTTESLPKAKVPDLPYDKPNGTPYRLDTDYFGKKRNPENPAPGPFELANGKVIRLKIWPRK